MQQMYDFAVECARKDQVIRQLQLRIEELQFEIKNLRKKLEQCKSDGGVVERPSQQQTRYWTSDEHKRFLEALSKFGPKDVKNIAAYVGSRNATQVRTHAQKYFLKLQGGKATDKRQFPDGDDAGNSGGEGTRPDVGPADTPQSVGLKVDTESGQASQNGARKRPLDLHVDVGSQPSSPYSDSDGEGDAEDGRDPKRIALSAVPEPKPQFVAKHISCVGQSIVCSIKGLTEVEYVYFLKGLLENAHENDVAKKCANIQKKYLQRFTPEDVQQCYLMMVNITKAKSAPQDPMAPTAPLGSPTDIARANVQHALAAVSPGSAFLGMDLKSEPATPIAAAGALSRAIVDDPFTNIDVIKAQMQEAERQAMANLSDLASLIP